MDERKQREILNELKEELNDFQKQCLRPLKQLSKVCKNCILISLFTNGEINLRVRNEEVFTEGIKNFLRRRNKFIPKKADEVGVQQNGQKIDILLKSRNEENVLILLEIKKTRENNSNGKINGEINGKNCYIKREYFKMEGYNIETLVIKVDNKYYNLDKIGESQVVAYKYNMEFSKEKNVIPAVYYLDKNELWYIKNIENIENRDEFIDCGIENFEVLKVSAEKI